MPKMKTHRGAAKRFKMTGSGKLRRRRAFRNHILEKKPSKRRRRLAGETSVAPGDASAASLARMPRTGPSRIAFFHQGAPLLRVFFSTALRAAQRRLCRVGTS